MEFGQNLLKPACVYAHVSTAKTSKYLVTSFLYSFLFFTQRLILCKSYIPIDLDRIYIVPLNLPQSLFASLHAAPLSRLSYNRLSRPATPLKNIVDS